MGTKHLRGALAASVAICAVAVATPAAAQTKTFDVPAQSAATGIPELARQADIQILVSESAVQGQRTRAVKGRMPVDQALRRLIAGTRLRIASGDGRTYTLSASDAAKSAHDRTQMASSSNDGLNRGAAEDDADIVVTGTNIRGVPDRTAPVRTITREEINRSGYTSTQQILQSLPQNFTGGASGASETGRFGVGTSRGVNSTAASGVNLRGLGNTSTLTLVNGRRVAAAVQGTAVDISLIPLAAIERVEILTDGASAVYGSDAVAGVFNIILRSDYDGAETGVGFGVATEGSLPERLASQVAGFHWSGGSAVISAQYRNRDRLPSSERTYTAGAQQPNDLLPSSEDIGLTASVRQAISPELEIDVTGLYTYKTTSRRYTDAFTSSDGRSETDFGSVSGSLRYRPSDEWNIVLSGSYSQEDDVQKRFYKIGIPSGYTNGQPADTPHFNVLSTDLIANGSVLDLPGGKIRLAFGGAYRRESAGHTAFTGLTESFKRDVEAVFGEIRIPVFGPGNAVPFVNRLEFSGALRYDHYSDVGSTTNPRIGIAWSPIAGVELRSSYSRSFRAPAASESFFAAVNTFAYVQPFSAPGGGTTNVLTLVGAGPALKPERSRNFNMGIELSPTALQGFRFSIDYYRIRFKDRIAIPITNPSTGLVDPGFAPLVNSFARQAEAQTFLNALVTQGAQFLDFTGTGLAGVTAAYDARQRNIATVNQSGFDISAAYTSKLGNGNISLNANVAIISKIDNGFTAGSSLTDISNTFGNPGRFRARIGGTWENNRISFSTFANYADAYRDTSAIPEGRIDSWTTIDMNLVYRPSVVNGLSIGVSALNIFDAKPPRAVGLFPGLNFDPDNASPLGRFISFSVRKRW